MKIELFPPNSSQLSFQPAQPIGDFHRQELSKILHDYNLEIGNESALSNVDALNQQNKMCVFTGQQLGFMGGPVYTILKAITCISLAREINAIPIFWLATEDHDVHEIDHTYLIDALGNLEKFQLKFPKEGHFVESLHLDAGNKDVLEKFLKAVNVNDQPKGDSYSKIMATYLAKLFKGTGLVFVEPYLLRHLAKPFFRKEIVDSAAIHKTLKEAESEILSFTEETNLFLKLDGGLRRKLKREGDRYLANGQEYSLNEILDLLEKEPQRFSANVAARTVMQSLLFPTVAYVAGPTEAQYYQQFKAYHKYHNVQMPTIVPRMSATMIKPHVGELLSKDKLNPWDEIPAASELLTPQELHILRNELHPRGRPQERVLNWYGYQALTQENLVEQLLKKANWKTQGHHYCYV